jgi:two-component system NtrC family sensor kinase
VEHAGSDGRIELLGAAVEQIDDGIAVARVDGTIEHANAAFLRSVGYSRADLQSLRTADLTQSGVALNGGQVLGSIRERGAWRGTLLLRRRDGGAYQASCSVVPLRGPAGEITHLVCVARDVTEEMAFRDQLVHTERLSAIGALVAGVAHELNNPLQTILGSAEVLLDEQPAGRRELELIRREASRAAQIVRNLLAFVRRTAPDRVAADLNDLVRTTIELRQYHLERSNIIVDVALHPDRLPIFVNREEIQQVVLNLVLNAEQALETRRGGRIAVRTFTRGGGQVVEIADDGPGIDKDLRGKIFEPFFTTKDVGQGTGLGLSISHGIALAHGGSLELCTQPRGACFQLTLPVYYESEATQRI